MTAQWRARSRAARRLVAVAASSVLFCCGAPQSAAGPTHSPSTTPGATELSPTPLARPALKVASSRYGEILVDGAGRALYLFDLERDTVPHCYAACATAWPPMRPAGSTSVAAELVQSLFGTTLRTDGTRQVTYNRHPLYYYAGDRAPGEIKCQAVFEFGGGWYVVDPRGTKITKT